ncbi:hypothetical protein COO91_10675 (plasmid) [Nostoc flagelliforme CCNUN1]|uniref:Uncharacterized protein n=1 Tax=Nostoc flagelliforme CCNUN1 TaxID=2038116 RepID=A0A2K8T9V7_9NOSO|nr:hypothetical protein COO91_10675 [Nostoc flagelliforme CCNUN1]
MRITNGRKSELLLVVGLVEVRSLAAAVQLPSSVAQVSPM